MNKFGFALAFVAAMVGLAVATEIGEFGGPGLHRGGFGAFETIDDDTLARVMISRGYTVGGFGGPGLGGAGLGGAGLGGAGLGGVGGGLRGVGRLNRRQFGGRPGFGLGAVGGVGAAGFRDSQASLGALNAGSHGFESGLAEKSQAGLLAGQKNFDQGQRFNTRNDNEGLHKHQLINSDKTIIKDKTFGVNDVDFTRNSNGVSQGSHASGSESGIAAGASQGLVAGQRERDNHLSAVGAESRDTAAGAAGAAGAVL